MLFLLSEILSSFVNSLKILVKSILNWPVPTGNIPLSIYSNIFKLFIYLVLKKEKKIVWIVRGDIKKPEKFSIAC